MTAGPKTICVPAMTFPATINAFVVTGHAVILCDVNENMQIDINTLSEKDKYRIDVIVPVHLMGYPANMDKIMLSARKYGWVVIEDTAEAFGGDYEGRKLGTIGHFGSYSFYLSHNIAGGELGLVVTDDDEIAKIFRSMKNHGRDSKNPLEFNHSYIGSNYKTTEFSAAIGLSQLNNVDELLNKRLDNAKYFFENIKNPNLKPFPILNGFSPLGYPIRATSEAYREVICKYLTEEGIETRHIFPCLNTQIAYQGNLGETTAFPVARRLEKEVFYIGVHQHITEEEKKKIVDVLNKG